MAAYGSDNQSLIVQSRQLLHTYVEIKAHGDNASLAVQEAFDEMERVNGLLNNYDPASDISRMNEYAGGPPVSLQPETMEALQAALACCSLTGGALDITVGPLIRLWGFSRELPGLEGGDPTPKEIRGAKDLVDYREVKIVQLSVAGGRAGTGRLARQGMWIDTGAFSKGYCADRAVSVLKQRGIRSALVIAGGTVCAIGRKPDGTAWKVAVRHPRKQDDFMTFIPLVDAAVSTSGDYERFYINDGKRRGHIIDPRTGFPVDRMQSVSVIAPNGLQSDALATALFVMGPRPAMNLVETVPDLSALLVSHDGKIYMSSNWPEKTVIY